MHWGGGDASQHATQEVDKIGIAVASCYRDSRIKGALGEGQTHFKQLVVEGERCFSLAQLLAYSPAPMLSSSLDKRL